MQSEILAFTEYEEEILFDVDDPDFISSARVSSSASYRVAPVTCSVQARVPSPMSLAGVHASQSQALLSRSQSFDTLSRSYDHPDQMIFQLHDPPVLTIEELRLHLNSCFTCGVSWQDQHVSLDCTECGGYSMQRPCARCNGKCDSIWKRDISTSHSCGKARWIGECSLQPPHLLLKPLTADLPLSSAT